MGGWGWAQGGPWRIWGAGGAVEDLGGAEWDVEDLGGSGGLRVGCEGVVGFWMGFGGPGGSGWAVRSEGLRGAQGGL